MQTKQRTLPRQGRQSPRFGHLGVWNLGLGPKSSIPSERLQVVIIDEQGTIVRRFEQVEGCRIAEGYVDFFNSPRCTPAKTLHPLVDIDPITGSQTELISDYTPAMGMDIYLTLLETWAKKHGRPEYAL